MKNKRKYENSAPATADEISKKSLKKLKKLTKPENPLAKEMKQKAAEYLVDRRNANCLIDILARLDCSEPGSVATAAIMAFKRVFMKVIEKQEIRRNKGESESIEDKFAMWLGERFDEGISKLVELIHHRKSSVAQMAVTTIMNLIQAQNWAKEKTNDKEWQPEDVKLLQTLILGFCSNRIPSKTGLNRFQEFLEYSDVSFHFISILARIVAKAAKKEKANFVFVDNVISCLESFEIPDLDKFSMCPLLLSAKDVDTSTGNRLDYNQLRKNFGTVWISILMCKFNLDQYKRSLIMLNEKVIPLLPKPLLLTDFLLSCYSVGGAISMLALSGVFTLITKYNLEYPDFYAKLYELFTVEIFYVKYKARFFHLADVFLSSTHLPVHLVAAFVKRIARISLQAPSESLPLCIRFIHNLLHRHRGLLSLIDSPERTDLNNDPFLAEESNPLKTCAVDSSLWEIKTLAAHILPEVSSTARDLLEKGVKESEKDLSATLEINYSDLMDIELKKKVFVNVPLTWESPLGLKHAKDDLFSELFDIE